MTVSTTKPAPDAPDPADAAITEDAPGVPDAASAPDPTVSALAVRSLTVSFGHGRRRRTVVHDVSLTLAPGECLALVGESGSGKSVTARSLIGLAGPESAVRAEGLWVDGRDATGFRERDWRTVRGRVVGLVSQDALGALDPLRRIGAEVAEPLLAHALAPRAEVPARVNALLADAGVPEPEVRARQYPHQLSGGLRQRALIASATAGGPRVIVADEPTTALDVTVQARVLELLRELKESGTALLLISHDLAVVAQLADRIAVMTDGRVVESGPAAEVLRSPVHPYTRTLIASVPGRRPPAPAPRPPAGESDGRPLLAGTGLVKRYASPGGGTRTAVSLVDFTVAPGETLGVVGESGSGKSTLAAMAMGLLAPDEGEVLLDGGPWSALDERRRRPLRRDIQLVHQDPLGSFDPRFTVRRILDEALSVAGSAPAAHRRERAAELLDQVGLDPDLLERRPARLSGGQRQRVAIARALATGPRLLVCDEPVSALDVTVQAQVLQLLARLRETYGLAMLFISHDLAVVQQVSDRVLVMRDGVVVEQGPVAEVLGAPTHPYTRTLLASVPRLPDHAS
ncbi:MULTISPECIES: ABC transporter ATP-binding protein [unclassified Streptomyces]|uniref:dipeptide ABC transporter ATP-binding protein n=1 Tax=unclassified Streptomyces TaxID=2593676 RepID=UPI000B500ABE|nr:MULTISPECIES: ABC transporter ATP-binding protein [unclassified Streptomyces]MYW98218.1 dipeptide ABC transporter ATP-binding protein [Streptomyces sp. SID8378]SNB87826.1 peptide/nickel transport system ATP-binding protein [Streptomyces sp. PgraA7]